MPRAGPRYGGFPWRVEPVGIGQEYFVVCYLSAILQRVDGAGNSPGMLGPPLPIPPHLLRTIAVPSPYLRRYIFGFRSETRGCSDAGVELVRRWYGDGGHNMRALEDRTGGLNLKGRFSQVENF